MKVRKLIVTQGGLSFESLKLYYRLVDINLPFECEGFKGKRVNYFGLG